jgi:hypothetical protein
VTAEPSFRLLVVGVTVTVGTEVSATIIGALVATIGPIALVFILKVNDSVPSAVKSFD